VWQNFVTEVHNPIVIIRKKFVAQQLASVSNAETKGGQKFKDNRKEETDVTRWVIAEYRTDINRK
jgi:hypothetical protein